MELANDDYILGYWFASDRDLNCWYMMVIRRDGKWMMEYTFRYNNSNEDDDAFSGKDEKSVYTVSPKNEMTEIEMIDYADALWNFNRNIFNNMSDRFLVQGGVVKFVEMAKEKDYLHLKCEDIK